MNFEVHKGNIVYIKDINTRELGDNVQDSDRPYAIISNNRNNRHAPTVEIAPFSTRILKVLPPHVFINGYKPYGLKTDSIILLEQVITIDKKNITGIVGTLDAEDMNKLNTAIKIQFDIA